MLLPFEQFLMITVAEKHDKANNHFSSLIFES